MPGGVDSFEEAGSLRLAHFPHAHHAGGCRFLRGVAAPAPSALATRAPCRGVSIPLEESRSLRLAHLPHAHHAGGCRFLRGGGVPSPCALSTRAPCRGVSIPSRSRGPCA